MADADSETNTIESLTPTATAPRAPSTELQHTVMAVLLALFVVVAIVLGWPAVLPVAAAVGCTLLLQNKGRHRAMVSLHALEQFVHLAESETTPLTPPSVDCPDTARLARAIARLHAHHTTRTTRIEAEYEDMRRTLETIGHGLLVVDVQHRILRANRIAEQLFGLSPDGWRGRMLEECVREPAIHELVSRCLLSNEVAPEELRLGDASRVYLAAVEPLHSGQGRPDGVLLVLDDITRLRRLEAMRTDFAANISHELRTPITNIRGYAETLLQMDELDDAQVRQFTGIIAGNATRLATLIEDILTLSFLESPQSARTLEFVSAPIAPIIEEVVEILKPTTDAREIKVLIECDPSLSLRVNRTLLGQAITNLLTNAIKFSPDGSKVRIRVGADGDSVRLSVLDEGPGIAPEHHHRLFERFFRVDAARSRDRGGTGLGLAIVKHIARVHGGDAGVESTIGKGSTFFLQLPAGNPRGL
ncbi:MAG: ATP-binding protein [Planctomycetota bacterium]|nr:ATP-binding protein [Planctomycetota bacterium]